MSSIIPPIAPTLALNFEQCRNNADALAMIKRYGLTFGRATTGWSMDRRGILTQAAINEPRVDFSSAGANRGYLTEPLAANLAIHSNNFGNAAWAKTSQGLGSVPVVTQNYAIAPDGSNNGWRLQCSLNGGLTTSDRSWLQQSIVGTVVPTVTSVYAKLNSPGSATFVVFNNGDTLTTLTSTDWVKIATVRIAATTSHIFRIGLIGKSGVSDTIDVSIWQGDLVSSANIGSSIIPTTTTSLSRSPDILTGTGISSLIGQSSLNLFAKVDTRAYNNGAARVIADIREDANNYIQLRKTTGDAFEFIVVAGGATQAQITDPTGSRSGVFNISARAEANSFGLWVNGAPVGTDVAGTVPALSKLGVGHAIDASLNASNWWGDRIGKLYLYNRGLSDAINANITRNV